MKKIELPAEWLLDKSSESQRTDGYGNIQLFVEIGNFFENESLRLLRISSNEDIMKSKGIKAFEDFMALPKADLQERNISIDNNIKITLIKLVLNEMGIKFETYIQDYGKEGIEGDFEYFCFRLKIEDIKTDCPNLYKKWLQMDLEERMMDDDRFDPDLI
jgi:hypothetical protein